MAYRQTSQLSKDLAKVIVWGAVIIVAWMMLKYWPNGAYELAP